MMYSNRQIQLLTSSGILLIVMFTFTQSTPIGKTLSGFGVQQKTQQRDSSSTIQEDEDVLELERLKTIENNDGIHKISDIDDILPDIEKELLAEKDIKNVGQQEQEEELSHNSDKSSSQNKESPTPSLKDHIGHDPNINPLVKSFHGAARLTFGQNPESVNGLLTTTQSSKITQSDENDEEIFSSLSETHNNENIGNDEKRSNVLKGPKSVEYLLQHSGGQYSSFDMAQYVFWTGDEEGVARAVEEFIQKGLMTRENAIKFLREISMGIEYLENSYSNRPFIEQNSIHFQLKYTTPKPIMVSPLKALPPLSPSSSTSIIPSSSTTITTTTTTEIPNTINDDFSTKFKPTISSAIQKAIQNLPVLLKFNEINNEKLKENSIDYDDLAGRNRLTDFLYAEYSLEEVIYQLAKVMFSQSLTRGSEPAQAALQRLTNFLESEGSHGRISPILQKKVLDVLLAALSDCLDEHPELIPAARAGLGGSLEELPKHMLNNKQ